MSDISFIRISVNEFLNNSAKLKISYIFTHLPVGRVIIAATPKGICYIGIDESTQTLKKIFPKALIEAAESTWHNNALAFFNNSKYKITLHLKATDFQVKVWKQLIKIPYGTTATYSEIARNIGSPNASRAVGNAIAKNPVALIIPCHRIIKANGNLGRYRWGSEKKRFLIEAERNKLM